MLNLIKKYFTGTLVFGAVSVATATLFLGGLSTALIVVILAVLEVSLSFDNAVVNAKQLKEMDSVWQHRFLTWGMLIAVFGMRVVFPLLIVAVVASISPIAALLMAINTPEVYATTLTSAHVVIAGFGMTFLMMVFLKFFFDKEKEVHWIGLIEKHLGKLEATEIAVTLGVTFIMSKFLPVEESASFITAGIMGLITYVLVDWLGSLMEEKDAAVTVVKTGLAGFLYLEVLDASFSFDGVIGAFALTNNIFVIAMGLGIGAFAVRGLTLYLVDKGTLSEFKFLEHGAFYAIGALAFIMGFGTFYEISEVLTGLIGAAFIGAALVSSIIHNRKGV
jgi:hypothetical protein